MQTKFILSAIVVAMAATLTAVAGETPFASRNEPHATIYLNGSPRAHGLYPVRVRAIDGQLTVKENTSVINLKPGTYKLQLRLESIRHMENLPGMTLGKSQYRTRDTLKLTVKPGHTYYIAGRVKQNGNWHPVIWKTGERRG